MRAARIAKLGARVGRFTKLARALAGVPSGPHETIICISVEIQYMFIQIIYIYIYTVDWPNNWGHILCDFIVSIWHMDQRPFHGSFIP